jgi:hypothetical protein
VQEASEHLIEYEGPAEMGESYFGGYFRLIRPGHHDREVAFRLSQYALEELCAGQGVRITDALIDSVVRAWGRFEIESELKRQGRVNPILVGSVSDLEVNPDLVRMLQSVIEEASAAEEPAAEDADEPELVSAHH